MGAEGLDVLAVVGSIREQEQKGWGLRSAGMLGSSKAKHLYVRYVCSWGCLSAVAVCCTREMERMSMYNFMCNQLPYISMRQAIQIQKRIQRGLAICRM
jgi:hypothetical protein